MAGAARSRWRRAMVHEKVLSLMGSSPVEDASERGGIASSGAALIASGVRRELAVTGIEPPKIEPTSATTTVIGGWVRRIKGSSNWRVMGEKATEKGYWTRWPQ